MFNPTDRRNARREPSWARRAPSALRECRTDEDFACEERREKLRDQRWRRWRSMIITTGLGASLITGQIPFSEALHVVLGALQGK